MLPLKQLCVLALVITTASCSSRNEEKVYSFDIGEKKDVILLSQISDRIDFIYFKDSQQSYFSQLDKVQLFNGLIYCTERTSASLLIFDMEGDLIKQIKTVGKGPDEYTAISDYCIDEIGERVVIYDLPSKSFFVYSLFGDFQERIKTSWFFDEVESLDGYFFGYAPSDHSIVNDTTYPPGLTVLDKGFRFVRTAYCPMSSIPHKKKPSLFKTNGLLLFNPFWSYQVFQVSSEGINPFFKLNFKGHMFNDKKPMDYFNVGLDYRINDGVVGDFLNISINSKFVYFNALMANSSFFCFVKKQSGEKLIGNAIFNDLVGAPGLNFVGSSGDCLYFTDSRNDIPTKENWRKLYQGIHKTDPDKTLIDKYEQIAPLAGRPSERLLIQVKI